MKNLTEKHTHLLQSLVKLIFFPSVASFYQTLSDSFPDNDKEVSFLLVFFQFNTLYIVVCCSFTTFDNFFLFVLTALKMKLKINGRDLPQRLKP